AVVNQCPDPEADGQEGDEHEQRFGDDIRADVAAQAAQGILHAAVGLGQHTSAGRLGYSRHETLRGQNLSPSAACGLASDAKPQAAEEGAAVTPAAAACGSATPWIAVPVPLTAPPGCANRR